MKLVKKVLIQNTKLKDKLLAFVLTLFIFQETKSSDQSTNHCTTQESCGQCIAEGPDCAWCTQVNYTEENIPRCNFLSNLKGKCDNTVFPSNSIKKVMDIKLSDKGAKEEEAVQIRPQEINLRLRPNSPETFPLVFRQAVDYPVDLYYLMDLSNTMKDDKEKLSELGNKLAAEMNTITTNFRLGFGSFVDKVAAPFTSMHPQRLKKPCKDCAPPYGFRNKMPLSLETQKFAEQVFQSKTSGNLDGPEGGLDAIMQAIVCKKEIGWRNKSRKLLVFTTDSGCHFAGDGRMGGIITPNDELCHLDDDGYYTMSSVQDYPSLSQLNRKINENKVNIIFAVTEEQGRLYQKLSKRLVGSSAGKLKGDSSNVVQLIREQYNKITSAVKMMDTVTSQNLQVTYESSCLGYESKKTNVCNGLKVGGSVTFDVTVEVTSCPEDHSQWNQSFYIYPVGLNEYLKVNLEMICECECEKPWNEEKASEKCNAGNGTYECGACSCYGNMFGKQCECDATESNPFFGEDDCIKENDDEPCSGLGECICGRCVCKKRSGEEKIYGTFCECDNFSCDKKNGKFCSGEDHGTCDCGKCKCRKGWTGEDCSCSTSTNNCIDFNGKECSDRGRCVCGSCVCDSTEQEYFGKYCDDCPTCPGKCEELRPCVECFIALQNNEKTDANCSDCNVEILTTNNTKAVKSLKEKSCSFEVANNCRVSFKYRLDLRNQPIIYVSKEKECAPPVDALAIAAGVSGGVVGIGLLLLALWKLITTIHDRRELAKFEKERLKAKWGPSENPIYKQAISTFQNPVYKGD